MNQNLERTATQCVQTLFLLAEETYLKDPELAQHYINIARKIAMAAKMRLPKECRQRICRHCKSYILPGVNCRVRLKQQREPHVTITCIKCGRSMRIPLKRKRMEKTFE